MFPSKNATNIWQWEARQSNGGARIGDAADVCPRLAQAGVHPCARVGGRFVGYIAPPCDHEIRVNVLDGGARTAELGTIFRIFLK